MASLKPLGCNGKEAVNKLSIEQFLTEIKEARLSQGESIEYFSFNKSRCRILTMNDKIGEGTKGILYWMLRDCRVQDNWAMLFAQRLALKNKLPLFVCYTIFEAHFLRPTKRHQQFLIDGLKCVERECKDLNIPFFLLNSSTEDLSRIIVDQNLGGVVCDFSPLKKPQEWIKSLVVALPDSVPVVQVDAHNIVPVWEASCKQEHMARTIRPKIINQLSEYLSGFPAVCKHPYTGQVEVNPCSFDKALSLLQVNWEVDPVPGIVAGPQAGLEMLHSFLIYGLKYYGISSSDPSQNHTSNLSFWLNFGHIASQRVALEVKSVKSLFKEQVEKYLEELIVRKELAENYCFFNDNYDNIHGAADWAKKTLLEHKTDERVYVYTREEFKTAATHDECWNAGQLQLLKEGKIHGYLRMYWCKKILEWTKSPEEAVEIALWLNDTFALDGNDPNGFVGVMWSICGIHDQGWKERAIFGKIRFMVDYSLKKKYDMTTYCARYGVAVKKSGKKNAKHKLDA